MQLTPDGRYSLIARASSGPISARIELATGQRVEMPPGGILADDGTSAISVKQTYDWRTDIGAAEVIAYDVVSGVETRHAALPTGFRFWALSGISGSGRYAGVDASNRISGDKVGFLVDLLTGSVERADEALNGESLENGSYGVRPSGDGSTFLFSFRDGPIWCDSSVTIYTWSPTGVSPLIAPSVERDMWLPDLSSDGRLVLFKTSIGPRYQLLDRTTGRLDAVPLEPSRRTSRAMSLSDDGERIALLVDREVRIPGVVAMVPVPAVYDRPTGQTNVLLDAQTMVASWGSHVELSANGSRVVFTAATWGVEGSLRMYFADLDPPGTPPTTTTTMPASTTTTTTTTTTAVATTAVATTTTTSPTTTTVPIDRPGVPGSLRAKPGRVAGEVALSWSPPRSAGPVITDYLIEHSTDRGATWATVPDGVSVATSSTVRELISGQRSSFRVAAVGATGPGEFTSPVDGVPR